MMHLHNPFKRKQEPPVSHEKPGNTIPEDFEPVEQPHISRGGVRKMKHKQWSADDPKGGGRVVKTMPRSLRHMKEIAEKTDD